MDGINDRVKYEVQHMSHMVQQKIRFITARVTDEFYKDLSRTASEHKTTLADMIRTALETFMEWKKKNGS